MTTKTGSDQNMETDLDQGDGERPAPRRPAFLNVRASKTEVAIAQYENRRREKRGW